jgi:integrase
MRMPKLVREMEAIEVRRLERVGLHFVGGVPGLALRIAPLPELPEGAKPDPSRIPSKAWILRVVIGGKRRDMGLGAFPSVSLADARAKAREARELIRKGSDPIAKQQEAQAALRAAVAATMTLRECGDAYITAHGAGWRNAKHGQQWRNTLKEYVYPFAGDLDVRRVALPHVMSILEPIWREKPETASRVRGRLESVLDWATARGYRAGENPARWRGHLDKLLPARSKVARPTHHAALPVHELGPFMQRLRRVEGMGARALEFAILTAARSGEARGALWSEIDLRTKLWTVPSDRMKAGKEHRVPLSDAACELLKALPRFAGPDIVFPAPSGGTLSDMTLSAVLRRMGVPVTVHGFRSTFRDWCAERTNYPHEVAEMALAHVVGNKVEAAYRRGDLFEKRRQLMQSWADFCAIVEREAKVIPMQTAAGR